jgi:hypothetical protein
MVVKIVAVFMIDVNPDFVGQRYSDYVAPYFIVNLAPIQVPHNPYVHRDHHDLQIQKDWRALR